MIINIKEEENMSEENNTEEIEDTEEIEIVGDGIETEVEDVEIKDEVDQDEGDSKKPEKEINIVKEILSWILVVVSAFLVAVTVNKFIIINAEIPSGSMSDTIMTGDRIIGWRFSYKFAEPERGDIVIFKYPDNEQENYIKRIIGLPGDKIEIVQGKVYLNDSTEPLEESYIKEEWDYTSTKVFEVPEDSYFMMGDNRNDSNDSRFWSNSYVHKDKILGKAILCYFPIKDFGGLK